MGCDAGMSNRRVAAWWRLLLAFGLLTMCGASAVAASPAAHAAVRHTPSTATARPAVSDVTSGAPTSVLHRTRHVHRTAPMLAAVAAAGVMLVVLLVGAGVVRRRASQPVAGHWRWCSSRAPPSRTSALVPFGQPSGDAGRLSRSPRALFSGPIPDYC